MRKGPVSNVSQLRWMIRVNVWQCVILLINIGNISVVHMKIADWSSEED